MSNEPRIKFRGSVKNGKLNYYKPSLVQKRMEELEGKEFEVTIEPLHVDVTHDQHGYYRGGIIRTCVQTETFGGWTEDEIHSFFATEFLSYVIHKNIGHKTVEIRKTESTAYIGKKRMASFIDSVLNYLATLGIYPEDPSAYIVGKYKTISDGTNKEQKTKQVPDKIKPGNPEELISQDIGARPAKQRGDKGSK